MPRTPTQTVRYQPDPSDLPNPERGWYSEPPPGQEATAAAAGRTLVMRYVRLDRYLRSALPESFLDALGRELAEVRGSGVKLILRFAYNRSAGPDAPLPIVLEHIRQLGPVLHRCADVIAVVQAGFIGHWGEWHHSTHELLLRVHRRRIVLALLDAVPACRGVAIRAPYWIRDVYPTGVTAETAYGGTPVSRVGQHDDCFLSGPQYSAVGEAYVAAVSRYTAMGGETCSSGGLAPFNGCRGALEALARYHVDYLNAEYYRPLVDRWREEGCHLEISKRLGYRFAVDAFTAPSRLRPGERLETTLRIVNEGFGKLYNPRPMQLVLMPLDGSEERAVGLAADARAALPEPGATATVGLDAALPEDLPRGRYDVYLELPDASPHLARDPAYSVRFANRDMWAPKRGLNDMRCRIRIA